MVSYSIATTLRTASRANRDSVAVSKNFLIICYSFAFSLSRTLFASLVTRSLTRPLSPRDIVRLMATTELRLASRRATLDEINPPAPYYGNNNLNKLRSVGARSVGLEKTMRSKTGATRRALVVKVYLTFM